MKKNSKLICHGIIFNMVFLSLVSFADQSQSKFSGKFEDTISYKQTKEYIQSRKDYYLDFLDIKEKIDPSSEYEKRLIDLLKTNFYDYAVDWTTRNQKIAEISALCYAAADIQCPTPITLFPDLYTHTIFWYEKYSGEVLMKVEDKLEDYPFMFLAVQCGQKSIPALQSMILDPKVRGELRIKVIATLMKIDPKVARNLAMEIMDEFPSEMQTILSLYLKNPLVEPWDVIPLFSSRGREIIERYQQR